MHTNWVEVFSEVGIILNAITVPLVIPSIVRTVIKAAGISVKFHKYLTKLHVNMKNKNKIAPPEIIPTHYAYN